MKVLISWSGTIHRPFTRANPHTGEQYTSSRCSPYTTGTLATYYGGQLCKLCFPAEKKGEKQ